MVTTKLFLAVLMIGIMFVMSLLSTTEGFQCPTVVPPLNCAAARQWTCINNMPMRMMSNNSVQYFCKEGGPTCNAMSASECQEYINTANNASTQMSSAINTINVRTCTNQECTVSNGSCQQGYSQLPNVCKPSTVDFHSI